MYVGDRIDSDASSNKPLRSRDSSATERNAIFRRNRQELSQMLSALLPATSEDVHLKYEALLDVPFISMSEILITREIGSGSFGRVFHGIFSFQDVAVKKLTVRNFKDEIDIYDRLVAEDENEEADEKARQVAETLLALEKEVAMLKRITFPKVVGFYGVCFEPAAIVSEYCARGSLFDLIARARSSSRVAKEMPWEKRLRLANDAAIGMNFLHNRKEPIIHKDLKSPNLLVDEHYNCKIADFNTAGFINANEMSKSQANNPRWLAPEIADGKLHTKASDVYPFGIILWELMTWRRPFEDMGTYAILIGIVQHRLRPEDVPNDELPGGPCPVYNDYVDLMKQCWDQDPQKRPEFCDIHKRLTDMIADAMSNQEKVEPTVTTPVRRQSSPKLRQRSPGPGISRSPRTSSPFSKHRGPAVMTDGTGMTSESLESEMPSSTPTRKTPDPPTEECFTSPFQNGPPSLDNSSSTSYQDRIPENQLMDPLSFGCWSAQTHQQPTQANSALVEYSDVVQNRPAEPKPNRGKMLWKLVSSEFGLDELTPIRTMQSERSPAIHRWDSVRTAIFGDPSTDYFKEQFESFLGGDETEELKKRLKNVNPNRGLPGLRIIRALMELREKKEREAAEIEKCASQEEVEKEDTKTSRWGLVKHLMLMNLPPAVHPMWRQLATSLKSRPSASSSNLDPIEEGRQTRGRELWKIVREAFLDPDYQRTKPVSHWGWQEVRKALFSDIEDEKQPVEVEETIPAEEENTENNKLSNNWKKIKAAFLGDVVQQNLKFMTKYAKTVTLDLRKQRQVQTTDTKTNSSNNRRVAIVDDEPPTETKWNIVRNLLADSSLGSEWASLREKARKNENPPRGTEWEIFRWLFFENKSLRNQPNWIIIKDLFLKSEMTEDTNSDPF